MKKISRVTRRMLIVGILILAGIGAVVGKYDFIGLALVGFLTLLKGDDD